VRALCLVLRRFCFSSARLAFRTRRLGGRRLGGSGGRVVPAAGLVALSRPGRASRVPRRAGVPDAERGVNFPAAARVYQDVARPRRSRSERSLAAYREHLCPRGGLDGVKAPLPGKSLLMCGISRGTPPRHAGYHAEGTGPGEPDIWVPPTAL